VGVQRANAGDCAGALDAFDQALRTSASPELHRDRGACHEKLGHPYPAIEDYRAYLVARPDAADAEAIRARVEALEESVGIVKAGAPKGEGAEVTTSIGGETESGPSMSVQKSGKEGADAIERNEELDNQADASPLRRGHGIELAVFFDGRGYGDKQFGAAEVVGADLRYALGPVHTLFLEATVGNVNSQGTETRLNGPGAAFGYEARVGLDKRVSDALLFGAVLGYQNLHEGDSGLVYNFLEPVGRFGYRHIFGPSFGLEVVLNAGIAWATSTGNGPSFSETTPLIGGHVGFVLGF
jgi:tetratricopeptide (TPR) repeat protein